MKRVVRWAIENSPAMNMFMVTILFVGMLSVLGMRREVMPEFELEIILVQVPYPGATPSEVEEGICQKIEESVRSIAGIKKMSSIAAEGFGYSILELSSTVKNVDKITNEVRSRVNQISSFPELAEDYSVQQITMRYPAIRVALMGPESDNEDAEWELREVAEDLRTELLQIPPPVPDNLLSALGQGVRNAISGTRKTVISQVQIAGGRDFQIDIEVNEETLRKYNTSLADLASKLRRQNSDVPAGTLRTEGREIILRGNNKSTDGIELGMIPILTEEDGTALTINDIATVRDEFTDMPVISEVDGKPALILTIERTSNEDLLQICGVVRDFVANKNNGMAGKPLPPGYDLKIWYDTSVDVYDRMSMLGRNGIQGLILVFLVLAVFLEIKLAFWVALGIPVSILGACGVLLYTGQTINMLTLFSFLLALGIVVDDAIVIGENIYSHRQLGKPFKKAAIEGTLEVFPAVLASVSTTIFAFAPLFFVAGVMGKFIAVIPLAVVAMLVISLVESMVILPCHLGHKDVGLFRFLAWLFFPIRFLGLGIGWVNKKATGGLTWFIDQFYTPTLRWFLYHPMYCVCGGISLMIITVGMIQSGITPFEVFPKTDSNFIQATVVYPNGTPLKVTEAATEQLVESLKRTSQKLLQDDSLFKLHFRSVGHTVNQGDIGPDPTSSGTHVGGVYVELMDTAKRPFHSDQILDTWRNESGAFPGAEQVEFRVPSFGPAGRPIEFKLLAPVEKMAELELAVEKCKAMLGRYAGVKDIQDDLHPGKLEYKFTIKESARALGVTNADVAEAVRAAFYGVEAMRLQRGRHEVKLMVRYPPDRRKTLADIANIRVTSGPNRIQRPLVELADIEEQAGYAEINRVEQLRSVTIGADVVEGVGNAFEITAKFQIDDVLKLQAEYPWLGVRWEGQEEQRKESLGSLFNGFIVALLCMFVLLTLEFRSYFQPFLILAIIPFGLIGAVWGHAVMGLTVTLFSMFGLVALTGVVINDSIVLVDFINRNITKQGNNAVELLVEAGRRRFRPVLLTSMTTIAGLFPLLMETSFQAKLLIPMATSLTFGLLVGTLLILYLVPTFYILYLKTIGRSTLRLIEEGNVGEDESSSPSSESSNAPLGATGAVT